MFSCIKTGKGTERKSIYSGRNLAGERTEDKSVYSGRNLRKAVTCAAAVFLCTFLSGCSGKRTNVDLDLSAMSGNVVYAEVFNIMMSPDDYVGKSIRMSGSFAIERDLVNDKVYTSCIIQDATACCAQGIEFDWAGEHTYPDDYPELDSEIEVTGVFERYETETGEYYHVAQAKMETL